MGFDYAAYQNELRPGADMDKALLVSFHYESEEVEGEWQNVAYISIFLGKNDTVERPVNEEDKERFADRWKKFLAGEDTPPEGMPVNKVPFANPSNIRACKGEKIYTVEQLCETPDARLQRAHLIEFKYMCRDMMEARNDGTYVQEMRKTIERQGEIIASLQEKIEAKPKKKPGRPKKVDNGDDS